MGCVVRRRLFETFLGCCLAVIAITGCSTTSTTDPNTNDNTASEDLTEAQQEAINDVVAQLETMTVALAGFADIADPQAILDAADLESLGTCPEVLVDSDTNAISITLDYGDGCTNGLYGESIVSGQIIATVSQETLTLALELTSFSVDGQEITGTATIRRQVSVGTDVVLAAEIDFAASDGAQIGGTITFGYDPATGLITISDGALAIQPANDSTTYEVAVSDLVIDPINNDSFIPESGTVSFDMPNDGPGPDTITVVVTFTAQSPVDGTVQVSIGGGPAIDYQVPGVGE